MPLPSSLSLPQMAGLGAGGYNPGAGFTGGPLGPMVPAGMGGWQQMGGSQMGGQPAQGDLRQLWQMVTQVSIPYRPMRAVQSGCIEALIFPFEWRNSG